MTCCRYPASGNLAKFGIEAPTHMFREAQQLLKAVKTRANYIEDGVRGDWNIVAEPTFDPTLEDNGLHGRDVAMRLRNRKMDMFIPDSRSIQCRNEYEGAHSHIQLRISGIHRMCPAPDSL
jgi:hypothetical protein